MQIDSISNWRRTHFSDQITPQLDGETVTVFGWVLGIRDLGGIMFITLGDREGSAQITLPKKTINPKLLKKTEQIVKQSVIAVRGKVKKSDRAQQGVEIIPEEIKILNLAQHPLALDPTGRVPADIDVRLNARVLDLRRPESQSIFKINHVATQAIRKYLTEQGFIEVHTPKIISSATEGGAALFPIIYFDREAFLAQSPQLYKEQLTTAFEKVFEIAPYFRAEESHTTRHISEFMSVDIEQAFVTAEDVMNLLEDMIASVMKTVKDVCKKELETLKYEMKIPSTSFKRYTYDQILKELKEQNMAIKWGEDIPTPAFRTIGESHPQEFYFIIDWPTKSKTFYIKPRDDKPDVSEGFDLMYSWIELASGGTRIHEKEQLIKRIKEQGLNPENFEYHLKTFESGMPPHAGWGLGLARLLMVLTGRENVRECVLFPRDRFRLTP